MYYCDSLNCGISFRFLCMIIHFLWCDKICRLDIIKWRKLTIPHWPWRLAPIWRQHPGCSRYWSNIPPPGSCDWSCSHTMDLGRIHTSWRPRNAWWWEPCLAHPLCGTWTWSSRLRPLHTGPFHPHCTQHRDPLLSHRQSTTGPLGGQNSD